eukprot:scaffold10157_cov142-Skeletonema_dohrnii-CCMP3373.AAC.7
MGPRNTTHLPTNEMKQECNELLEKRAYFLSSDPQAANANQNEASSKVGRSVIRLMIVLTQLN